MNTTMLAEELERLNIQVEQARQKYDLLESELRAVEAELQSFAGDRQRFDALRDACHALDKLKELKSDDLFWGGIPESQDIAGQMERARSRLAAFEGEISGVLEQEASLHQQIHQCLDELDFLDDEIRNAYGREERRQEEYVIEREISDVPYRETIMPWTRETESEKRFRRYLSVALLLCFFLSTSIALINLPVLKTPPLVAPPERLVSLLKEEPPKPVKVRKQGPKPVREEPDQAKKAPKPKPDTYEPEQQPPEQTVEEGGGSAAREKAETAGVLKFKEAFKDLMKETTVAKLGTEARLSIEDPRVKGQAVAQRSLVALQGGSSGGIANFGVSRNVGYGKGGRGGGGGSGHGSGSGSGIGSGDGSGVGYRAKSNIADLEESSRPTIDGMAAGRTDEEIQIVFDRYKASLYRIYNRELRKDPTLRGKILVRMSIEPDGAVSMCKAESSDLASAALVAEIVERIKRFNFGPKEGVQKMTILYPIDFLPGGETSKG